MKKKTIIIISILIITLSTIILFQQKESYSIKNNIEYKPLVKEILKQNTILETDQDEVGLYKENDYYYFKGNVINNYLKINNELWQIISIDSNNNVKVIKEEPIKENKYVINNNYENGNYLESSVYAELKKYYEENLKDNKSIIKDNYCIEYNGKCLNTHEEYIGLITEEELLRTKTNENNLTFIKSTNFWIMSNTYLDKIINEAFFGYYNETETIDEAFVDEEKYIIPVITIDGNTNIQGEGTIENPYILIN